MDNTQQTTDVAKELGKMLNNLAEELGEKAKSDLANKLIYNENTQETINNVASTVSELADYFNKIGYKIAIYENIDALNISSNNKFFIKIEDMNGAYVTIDLIEYRNIVLDFDSSERDYIVEQLEKMRGFNEKENRELADKICDYLQYLFYFNELKTKIYENIGWDYYNGEIIFKYNRMYPNDIMAECNASYVDALICDNADIKLENWLNKTTDLFNQSKLAGLIISSACTGIFRQILPRTKENNINMNIVGAPGSGKTTIGHFALSFFGKPSVLEGSFSDKPDAIELNRVKRPIIPYILDERMLAFEGRNIDRELKMSIFREYEGKVKERAAGSSKELSGQRTYAPIISSSVESVLDRLINEKDVGQFRRFMEFEISKEKHDFMVFNSPRNADMYEELSESSYGIGVYTIINSLFEYTAEEDIKIIDYVTDLYKANCSKIDEKLEKIFNETGIIGLKSSTQRFALIITTYDIIVNCINYANIVYIGRKIRNREDELIDMLISNLVEKMKLVQKGETSIYNLINFINSNQDLFLSEKATKWYYTTGNLGVLIKREDKLIIYTLKRSLTVYIIEAILKGTYVSPDSVKDYIKEMDANNENSENEIKEANKVSLKKHLGIELKYGDINFSTKEFNKISKNINISNGTNYGDSHSLTSFIIEISLDNDKEDKNTKKKATVKRKTTSKNEEEKE